MPRRAHSPDLVFHALGDPKRRAIIQRLSRGPATASDLALPLALTLAAIVQHLQILQHSGLIESTKSGRVRTCRLNPAGLLAAEAWIASQRAAWERRLDRLGDLLDDGP